MKQNFRLSLPIDSYLEDLAQIWQRHSTIIVKASPGSGKTTRLPWKIASLSQKKVIVLEPRRLAAKLAAQRIASEENLKLGKDIGYHFRFEKNYSTDTRLIFYTEGTFLKRLLQDPEINDVGTVILDEFHERHVETDVALAALRGLQAKRSDLKLILMSATLDSKLGQEFPDASLMEIEARQFEVLIHYLPNQPSILNLTLETKIKRSLESMEDKKADVLVFVPGMREMNQVRECLGSHYGEVFLLHSELSKEEQEEALKENPKRKIILATNIAESSVTIPGIKAVIDCGLQREAKYSPWTGLKTLEDRPITQSSAIQRSGRAGRTSDGICYRLYSEQDYNSREKFTIPEILKADLTDTYLLSLQLQNKLLWFTPPPVERWAKARELAIKLGAANEEEELTSVGKQMLSYPLSARLSRALLAGENLNLTQKKKLLSYICEVLEKDSFGLLQRRLNFYLKSSGTSTESWEKAILQGFIDQVAKLRRKQHDFIHYSGKTLKQHASLKDLHEDFYLVLDVNRKLEAITVLPIEEEWLYEINPFPFTEEEALLIDESFQLKRLTKLGSIPLEEETLPLHWSSLSQSLKNKVLILGEKKFRKFWEEWQEDGAFLRLHYWCRYQKNNFGEIEEKISLKDYLNEWEELNWNNLQHYFQHKLEEALGIVSLEESLPLKINVGGKRDLQVHYPYGLEPFIEAPIQDFYGVNSTPHLIQGQVPLTLKLLGPHKRPIQVTKDLEGFWKKTYQEMKREWQRDYPRHYWPDNPESAKPVLLKRQL